MTIQQTDQRLFKAFDFAELSAFVPPSFTGWTYAELEVDHSAYRWNSTTSMWEPLKSGCPSASAAAEAFVSKAGNDTTGDGSSCNPFLTIQRAITSITDASTLKRYIINLGPGSYLDPFALIPWVFIVGGDQFPARIFGAITLDSSWFGVTDKRSGFTNVRMSGGPYTFDFDAANSQEGKLYFVNCTVNQPISFIAGNAINQVSFEDCEMFADLNLTGMNTTLSGTYFVNSNNVVIQSSPKLVTLPTIFQAFGGGCGSFLATWTAAPGINNMVLVLNGFVVNTTTVLSGVQIAMTATDDSVGEFSLLAGAPPISFVSVTSPRQYTVATLPSGSAVAEGLVAYAIDGHKLIDPVLPTPGTGVPVYYSVGAWRVFSTDLPVT